LAQELGEELVNNGDTHVLVIEADPGDGDLIRQRLVEGDSAVRVSCVNRLAEGLESMAKELPSVVLLDLNLPDSPGVDPLHEVIEKAPGVPVVILLGQGEGEETMAMNALHQGAQDYLLKGDLTSSHLERVMHGAIEKQALIRSLALGSYNVNPPAQRLRRLRTV
jgi:two-component system, cell cycle response regulator